MNAAGIAGIIVGASVATAAVSYVVFRTMGVEVRRRHAEVGTAIFLQLGVIYAVFLAFVFGQALTSFVAADDAIDAECAALHAAAILAKPLPKHHQAKLAGALQAYIAAVIDTEWPAMRASRRSSAFATLQEEQLMHIASTLDVQSEPEVRTQARLLGVLIDAHKSREARLFEARQGIPTGLWVLILVYCGSLVALVFFSSLEYVVSHAILSGIFGGLNALVLLAVFALQYPFEGPFKLSPETFVLTSEKIATTFER